MRPCRRPRRGWSLLELLVVITVVSILMGFTAALAARMIQYGKGERAAVVAAANLERLGRDLRNDARAANAPAELSETSLVLTQAEGRSIEYLVRPADILRTIRRSGKTEGFDTYKLPTGTLARFESGRDGRFPSVALVLRLNPATNPSSAAESAYRDYRIEAVPGRDSRLARGVIR
jgi:prepilin-type N-terminal cleavage/methylation domain-containing protein